MPRKRPAVPMADLYPCLSGPNAVSPDLLTTGQRLNEIRALLGLAPDAYFYAMLFGVPKVRYVRTVQRDGDVKLRRLAVQA